MDHNGRPIKEKYQHNVHGAIGEDGKRIGERQQMYEHSGTGLQKIAHERMLDKQGRKVVRERLGDQMNSYDHYKHIREDEADRFDEEWKH